MTLNEFLSSLQTTVHPEVTSNSHNNSTESPTDSEGVSLGLAIPIVLIAVFLIVVAVCIYWHSFRKRRRKSNLDSTFARSFNYVRSPCNGADFVRASTSSSRSTTPLHASALREKVNVIPLTDKNSSERFHFYWDKDNWKLVPPDAVGQHTRGVPLCLRHQLSPIDEMDTPMSADIYNDASKSYEVAARAPFSPYRLTWVTPTAPPPSYEESEISSLSKCHTRPSEINTTRTTEENCSACNHRGKEGNSPFYPNNNTPTTEYELASEQGTLHINMLMNTVGANNTNSQNSSSYPSSPRSSSSESLTTSNIDRGVDASLMTSYPETSYPQSSLQSSYQPPHPSERTSVIESDTGIPSLPSSILFYHQKMAPNNNNNNNSGRQHVFSQYAYDNSLASSIESNETHYTDNTSMLPNVGSAANSDNRSSTQVCQLRRTETSHNISPEDLSRIVSELSSIRPGSNEPVDRGIVNSAMVSDGAVGQSYVPDVFAPQNDYCSTRDQPFHQSVNDLFRSWSVTAELDYSPMSSKGGNSMQTPLHEDSFSWDNYPWHRNRDGRVQDVNHNIIDLNTIPIPGRRVQFDVPVLVDKTYWV